MKQKDKVVSSLIIALVAGFIYYAFADFDVIKKIPQLAYETIKTAIIETKSEVDEIRQDSEKNIATINKDENVEEFALKPAENIIILEDGVFAHIPNISNLIRFAEIDEDEIISKTDLKKLEKLQDFGFNTRFSDGAIEFARYDPYYDYEELDSHKTRVHIRIKDLDSLNIYLDNSMLKLNESLSKLNEQLLSEEFLKNIPEFDREDIDVEVDADEIKEAIKESMKEFDENMKEFHFDMKEFKDSMKMFKESMKELKKNMKDLDSAKLRHFDKKIEIIES